MNFPKSKIVQNIKARGFRENNFLQNFSLMYFYHRRPAIALLFVGLCNRKSLNNKLLFRGKNLISGSGGYLFKMQLNLKTTELNLKQSYPAADRLVCFTYVEKTLHADRMH